jgi:hypothetical protein
VKINDVFDFHSEIQCSVTIISLEELLHQHLKSAWIEEPTHNKLRWNEYKEMNFDTLNTDKKYLPEKKFIQRYIKKLLDSKMEKAQKSFYCYNKNFNSLATSTYEQVDEEEIFNVELGDTANLVILPFSEMEKRQSYYKFNKKTEKNLLNFKKSHQSNPSPDEKIKTSSFKAGSRHSEKENFIEIDSANSENPEEIDHNIHEFEKNLNIEKVHKSFLENSKIIHDFHNDSKNNNDFIGFKVNNSIRSLSKQISKLPEEETHVFNLQEEEEKEDIKIPIEEKPTEYMERKVKSQETQPHKEEEKKKQGVIENELRWGSSFDDSVLYSPPKKLKQKLNFNYVDQMTLAQAGHKFANFNNTNGGSTEDRTDIKEQVGSIENQNNTNMRTSSCDYESENVKFRSFYYRNNQSDRFGSIFKSIRNTSKYSNLCSDFKKILLEKSFLEVIEGFPTLKLAKNTLERVLIPQFRNVTVDSVGLESDSRALTTLKEDEDEPIRVNNKKILAFISILVFIFIGAILFIFLSNYE